MKAKVTISSLVLIIMFCFNSCKQIVEDYYAIWFQNDSTFNVFFSESYNYPDTSLLINKPEYFIKVSPNSKYAFDSPVPWEEVFKNDIPSDTLIIFAFSETTIKNNLWEEIQKQYKILYRYDLSLQDLKEDGMYVYYPPK